MRISDWSSDVCSSDLPDAMRHGVGGEYPQSAQGREKRQEGAADLGERIHARRLPDVTQTVSGYILTLSPLTASGRRSAAPLVVVGDVIPDIAPAERRQQIVSDGPEIGRAACRERVCQDG